MNKWNYLVAALLIGGASTTFTACIDNDEPFGLEQMRTAKSEFYSAQAAYKMAEVAYLNSQTAIQQELLKQEEIETEMKKLQLERLKVQDAAEREKIDMQLAELKARHEVTLKNIETEMTKAEAAYQAALRDLDLVISKLNSDYSKEYARLLGNITANRAEYGKLAAELVDAKLELNLYSERTLDTLSVRATLERNVKDAQQNLDYLEEQKELLTALEGADSEERVALAKELNEKIRTQVAEYNEKVKEHQTLEDQKAEADNALTNKRNELLGENALKKEEEKSGAYEVDALIQNAFVQALSLTTQTDLVSIETFKDFSNATHRYYTLRDANYEVTAESSDITHSLTSTAAVMEYNLAILKSQIANKFLDIDTPVEEAAVDATLPSKEAWLEAKENAYNTEFNKFENVKNAYIDAANDVMLDAGKDLYETTEEAIDAFNWDGTPAATDEEKAALVALLKDYGQKREAYDGFVAMDGVGDDAKKEYEKLTAETLTETLADKILGTVDLTSFTATAESAKGALTALNDKLFGTGNLTLVTPELETEYKVGNTTSIGGLFGEYFKAYAAVQNIKEQKAWKALYTAVDKDYDAYLLEVLNLALLDGEVDKNEQVVELQNKVDELENQIEDIEKLVGATPTVITVTVVGDVEDQAITLSDTPYGSMGTYLTSLKNYHNAVVTENSDFTAELAKLEEKITTAQGQLAEDKNKLELFKAGGWKLTDASGGSEVKVELGNEASAYKEVKLTESNGTVTATITYYDEYGYVERTEVIEYPSTSFDISFEGSDSDGSAIEVTSEYLQVVIEAYEAKVANIEAQMKDLDEMLVILQKELADFMEVLKARYPDTAGE